MSAVGVDMLAALADLEREALELEPGLRRRFLLLRKAIDEQGQELERLRRGVKRYQNLLEHSLALAGAGGAGLIASEVLDVLIGLAGAQRGFVGLVEPKGWRLLVARSMTEEDLGAPEAQVSTGIIEEALASRAPVLSADAHAERWAAQASVRRLGLRSVACLPILREGRALGFVYVDDPTAVALFDEDTVEALSRWLPVVAEHLASALWTDEEDPFPGYVTRSVALRGELTELARLARFDVPVLITGENLPLRKSRTPPAGPSSRRGAACPSASRPCRPRAGCGASRAAGSSSRRAR